MPPKKAAFQNLRLLALLSSILALLVSNTAAGLASGLARSLALAASTVLCTVAEVAGFDGCDMFHNEPPNKYYVIIIAPTEWKVNILALFILYLFT